MFPTFACCGLEFYDLFLPTSDYWDSNKRFTTFVGCNCMKYSFSGPEAQALPRHSPLQSISDDHINKMISYTRKTTIIVSVATTCVAVTIMVCGAAALFMRSEKHDKSKRKQDGETGSVYVIDAELEADDFDSLLDSPKRLVNGDVRHANPNPGPDECCRHLLRPLDPVDETIQDNLPPIEEMVQDGGHDEVMEDEQGDADCHDNPRTIIANGSAKLI
jgi:hypothetical protein